MDNNYRLLDLTVNGRQETWEDSPAGWPQGDIMDTLRSNGRPTSLWSRLTAGCSDGLTASTNTSSSCPKVKSPMEWWVRRHDDYEANGSLDPRWIKVVENAKVILNLND
jgi:hypothetical protein